MIKKLKSIFMFYLSRIRLLPLILIVFILG